MLGDTRYNDRLSDNSPKFFQADLEQKHKFLARFVAVDPAGFPPQDTLSRELMIRELRQDIEGAKFRHWEMPVNQMGGLHLELPDLIELTPFKTVSDYDHYLARLHQIPHAFDQVIANMRRDYMMAWCLALSSRESRRRSRRHRKQEWRKQPVCQASKEFPSSVPGPEQKRLREAVLMAIADQVVPTYQRFAAFVRTGIRSARSHRPRNLVASGRSSALSLRNPPHHHYRNDARGDSRTGLKAD